AAMSAYQDVLRLNPQATAAKVALAQLNLAQGRPDASVGYSAEALVNEPDNGEAHLVLARGLLATGDLGRAESELHRLLTQYSESPAVHTEFGMLLIRKRDFVHARQEFERALSIQPDAIEALAGLSALDTSLGNFAAANARVDARVEKAATPAVLTLAARTHATCGDLPTAE